MSALETAAILSAPISLAQADAGGRDQPEGPAKDLHRFGVYLTADEMELAIYALGQDHTECDPSCASKALARLFVAELGRARKATS